jgi:hypothetical protein
VAASILQTSILDAALSPSVTQIAPSASATS